MQEYVSNLNVENTIENIIAADNVLENGYSVYREADKRKNILTKRSRKSSMILWIPLQSIWIPKKFWTRNAKSRKIIEEVLAKSYEQSDITIEDLKQLKQLSRGMHFIGAIRQEKVMIFRSVQRMGLHL